MQFYIVIKKTLTIRSHKIVAKIKINIFDTLLKKIVQLPKIILTV